MQMKSWLAIFVDPAGSLHFYDNNKSLEALLTRIKELHPDYKLLEVRSFANESDSATKAAALRRVYADVLQLQRLAAEKLSSSP